MLTRILFVVLKYVHCCYQAEFFIYLSRYCPLSHFEVIYDNYFLPGILFCKTDYVHYSYHAKKNSFFFFFFDHLHLFLFFFFFLLMVVICYGHF